MDEKLIKDKVQQAIDTLTEKKVNSTEPTPKAESLEDIVRIVSLDCKQFSADLIEQSLINLFADDQD